MGDITKTSMDRSSGQEPCSSCAEEMAEDMLYIFNRIEEIRAFSLQEVLGNHDGEGE